MSAPAHPHPPAAPHQAQAQPLQNQSDVPLEEQEPTYTIFGGDDGSQLIQFHMAPGQSVLLSGSTAGFLYAHPDVHVMSFMRQYVDDSSISKDDLYTNSGREPLLYLGAAAPHTGKILPVPVGGERMPLLVQDDCYLASTGLVNHKQVFLKTGEGLLQMTRIVPRPYTEYETRRSVRGRPATATVFVQSPGSIMETSLGPNESLHVYTSAIVALTEGVTLNPPWVNPAGYGEKKMKDGCLVRGPGTLYISGLPFSKQARRLLDTSPPEPDRYSSVRWFLTVVGAFFLSLVIYQLVFKQTGR